MYSRTLVARYASHCPKCNGPVSPGEVILKTPRGWGHFQCSPTHVPVASAPNVAQWLSSTVGLYHLLGGNDRQRVSLRVRIPYENGDGFYTLLYEEGKERAYVGSLCRLSVLGETPGELWCNHKYLRSKIEELNKDPGRTAGEWGKLMGRCCFCGLRLSDSRSVEVGYGKICATNWRLPWGEHGIVDTVVELSREGV